jgi:hypothetical protein
MAKVLTLCLVVVVALASIVALSAQAVKERFNLQFEISEDGAVISQPVLKLEAGQTGTLVLKDGVTLKVVVAR